MATITDDNNNDLLILDENTTTDDVIVDETITENDNTSLSDELITFDEGVNSELDVTLDNNTDSLSIDTDDSLSDIKVEEDTLDIKIDDSIDTFDLTDIQSKEVEEEDKVDNMLLSDNTDDNSFDLSKTESITDDSSLNINESEWTMVDILGETISKLNSRADLIANEITTEESNEVDLKNQILELETEVLNVQSKIS